MFWLDDLILLFPFNDRIPLSVITRTMELSRSTVFCTLCFIFYINLCLFPDRKIYICSGSQILW